MIGAAHHVGIAVRRLDDALAAYRRFGLELESQEDLAPQGVRIAFLRAGGVRVELLASLREDSAVARFLEKRGEGLHHLAFATGNIRAELGRLREAGFDLVDAEPRRGARGSLVAFLHPKSAHGVLLELVQEATP